MTGVGFDTGPVLAHPAAAGDLFSTYQITKAGCNPDDPDLLACLRKVDAFEYFMDKSDWPTNTTLRPPMAPVMPWGPVIDGSSQGLPKRPLDMIRDKGSAAVPLIIGTNKDEVQPRAQAGQVCKHALLHRAVQGSLFIGSLPDIVPGNACAQPNCCMMHLLSPTTVLCTAWCFALSSPISFV